MTVCTSNISSHTHLKTRTYQWDRINLTIDISIWNIIRPHMYIAGERYGSFFFSLNSIVPNILHLIYTFQPCKILFFNYSMVFQNTQIYANFMQIIILFCILSNSFEEIKTARFCHIKRISRFDHSRNLMIITLYDNFQFSK